MYYKSFEVPQGWGSREVQVSQSLVSEVWLDGAGDGSMDRGLILSNENIASVHQTGERLELNYLDFLVMVQPSLMVRSCGSLLKEWDPRYKRDSSMTIRWPGSVFGRVEEFHYLRGGGSGAAAPSHAEVVWSLGCLLGASFCHFLGMLH